MAVRLLFLLLLALNLGAGAWLLFGRPPERVLPPLTDPGVPVLRIVTPGELAHAVAAHPAAAPHASAPTEVCASLGPFTTTADMQASLQALTTHVARIQYREEQVSQSHGFWVYLPATATREAALQEAHRLAAKGIHDYYVVSAGDAQNTISLGLFDDDANAENRMAQIKQLGFPAQVKQRVDTEPAYWIDYAVAATTAFKWQAWLPDRSDLAAKPIDCF